MAILVVLTFSVSAFAGVYGGGSGTEADPYLISTAADMNAIGADVNDWGSHFVMTADINLANYTGEQFNIIGNDVNAFTGVFDGNGFTISNFTYKETLSWPILPRILDHTNQRSNTLKKMNNILSDDSIQNEPIVIPTPNDINWTPIPIPFPPRASAETVYLPPWME